MNSYRLNGIIGSAARASICRYLKIRPKTIYKEIKNISAEGVVTTKDGKHYILTLEQIILKTKL